MKTMRPPRIVLPLALLSAAFLLSCQDQASSPVEPDGLAPLFAKVKTCPDHPSCKPGDDETEDADFNVSFMHDVAGSGVLVGPNGGKNNLQNSFGVLVTINLTGFRGIDDTFQTCFSVVDIESIMQVSQVKPSNIEDAQILFFFDALGTDGATAVSYALTVLGTFDDGPWPPTGTGIESNTIEGDTFVLAHSNGPGNKVACTGEGDITFELLVELQPAA